ncbi:MAG: Mfa1 family fimbria major subunit [Tannerellaceae bacterium]|nr:Mfa1 family fimbria major subunit [Tannerellaceae bacterium]
MKQMFKSFAVSAAIAAGITACSNEEIVPDVQPTIERANLTIVVNNNAAATRAVEDNNAVAAETQIKSITLFVYGAATTAEDDTTFNLSAPTDFADGTNVYKVTFNNAPIGNKKVYVGVNLSNDLRKAIHDKGVSAVNQTALTELSSSDKGFPMFSDDSKPFSVIIEQGKTNELQVSVKRFVAKVTAETTEDFENNVGNARKVDGVEIDKNLTFAMGQVNTKFFPYIQKTNGVYQDPNYFAEIIEGKLGYQSDFTNEFYDFKANSDWTSTTDGVFNNFKSVTTKVDAADIKNFKPGYVLENTNALKKEGELTFAFIKAKFIPEFTHEYSPATGIKAIENTAKKNDYSKLYVFDNGGNYYYFQDKTQADSYKSSIGIDYMVYTDCTCFYMVYLGEDAKNYAVLRNDYIKLQIEKVMRLGDPYQGPTDPIAEKGGKAALQVSITVQAWNTTTQSVQLGE